MFIDNRKVFMFHVQILSESHANLHGDPGHRNNSSSEPSASAVQKLSESPPFLSNTRVVRILRGFPSPIPGHEQCALGRMADTMLGTPKSQCVASSLLPSDFSEPPHDAMEFVQQPD